MFSISLVPSFHVGQSKASLYLSPRLDLPESPLSCLFRHLVIPPDLPLNTSPQLPLSPKQITQPPQRRREQTTSAHPVRSPISPPQPPRSRTNPRVPQAKVCIQPCPCRRVKLAQILADSSKSRVHRGPDRLAQEVRSSPSKVFRLPSLHLGIRWQGCGLPLPDLRNGYRVEFVLREALDEEDDTAEHGKEKSRTAARRTGEKYCGGDAVARRGSGRDPRSWLTARASGSYLGACIV